MSGNTGINGEQALIDKINKIDEGYFLVRDFSKNYLYSQQPLKAIDYVRKNFEYVNNIYDFEVYYKGN